jgi:hypothetical protein
LSGLGCVGVPAAGIVCYTELDNQVNLTDKNKLLIAYAIVLSTLFWFGLFLSFGATYLKLKDFQQLHFSQLELIASGLNN